MQTRMPLWLAVLAATAGTGLTAAAWAADDTAEALDEVTIIGRRLAPADVPGSVHVVDAAELAKLNASDILRVLRTVPGVYVQEEEGFGLRPNIGIRGSGLDRSARIALLEDGVLIAPAPYAAPSAYYFPTQRRMQTVEVLKGPASIVVGPRTTGGAVNLVSTMIPASRALTADLRAGEHGGYDAHVAVGDRGSRAGWLVETVQAGSDGFKTIDGHEDRSTGFGLRDYVAKLRVDGAPEGALQHSLQFKIGYTDLSSDETYLGLTEDDFAASPFRRYAASANDRFDSTHRQMQATWSIDRDGTWRTELTAYRNEFARNWYKLQSVAGTGLSAVLDDPVAFAAEYGYLTGTTSPDDAIAIRANNRRYLSQGVQGRVVRNFDFRDADVALTAGLRLHEDEEDRFQHEDGYRMVDGALQLTSAGAGGSQSNRLSSADVVSAFVTADIETARWILTPGLRYESIDLERADFSTADPQRGNGPTRLRSQTEAVFVPGIGAMYRLAPAWRLIAGVHRGYNPPAPGSAADAETSLNIEAGIRYGRNGTRAEVIAFVNDYDNLVGTVTASTGGDGQIGDQFDGGEVTVSGLEIGVSTRHGTGALTVPLDLRYTWTREAEFENAFESDFDPWGDVVAGDELPYIPAHQLQLSSGIEAESWRINLAANWVDDVRTVAGQGAFEPDASIDSHVVWDALAEWRFRPSMFAYLKVDNLFDETYAASRRPAGLRPGLPRTAYVGIRLAL
ncbi:MAG: TonB-dependent receptor [Woeseiaceae bacterium]|nr:TonB-dependent receptor [Woeseiaceae bacterium]